MKAEVKAMTATPIVVWYSDPVAPGETVLLVGEGLTAGCRVEIKRLALNRIRVRPGSSVV